MAKKDGGPAFPNTSDSSGYGRATGLSLRDYFAAKAMQAIIAGEGATGQYHEDSVAESAYEMADAMLQGRD